MIDQVETSRRWLVVAATLTTVFLAITIAFWFFYNRTTAPGDATDPDQVAFGSRIYGRICASCHGADLAGQLGWEDPMKDGTRLAPAHNTKGKTWHHADRALFNVVKLGGEYLRSDGSISRMPAFQKKLTDEEIWAVIAFIKSSWPAAVQDAQQSVISEEDR